MPIRVDELTTEVITESEAAGGGSAGGNESWRETVRIREAVSRIRRDQCRTAAEEFDD